MNIESLWYGNSFGARMARATAAPLSWLYGAAVGARNTMYDRGVLRVHAGPIPVVSIGNLTVGGTGKTPFSAYIVRELLSRGHRPAVVMRDYGADEVHLHAELNPGVPVVAGADRVAGIASAHRQGADVAVLDDAFQHRRALRALDIVLVSADRWSVGAPLLPAGPMREPLGSLARADLVVVTYKRVSEDHAVAVADAVAPACPRARGAVVASIAPNAVVATRGQARDSLDALKSERVLAFAGVGDPDSFFAQLVHLGARVTARRFRDHHAYTAADAADLAEESRGHKYALTTQKDAVKLSKLWPANGPELWYLSQAVRIVQGQPLLASALAKLFNEPLQSLDNGQSIARFD